jgi:hypothetical protein
LGLATRSTVFPVATAERAYSIGIVTLKNRTLAPFANVLIDNAREIAMH